MRTKNASQHPGYIQKKPCEPAVDKPKMKKQTGDAVKAEEAAAKKFGAARVLEFKKDTMAKEEMLDVTPHPVFSSTAGRHDHVPASGPGAPGSISKSNVDIDELNPDKGTCKSVSMTENDSADNLSIALVLPPKGTYAEVVSPRGKGKAGSNALATLSTVTVKDCVLGHT